MMNVSLEKDSFTAKGAKGKGSSVSNGNDSQIRVLSHGFHEFARIIQKESVKICEICGKGFMDFR
jgi:hypothetical protein